MAQILVKRLQMIFQTSNVSICNGSIKDPIGASTSTLCFMFKLFYVSVAVAITYYFNYHPSWCLYRLLITFTSFVVDNLVCCLFMFHFILFVSSWYIECRYMLLFEVLTRLGYSEPCHQMAYTSVDRTLDFHHCIL